MNHGPAVELDEDKSSDIKSKIGLALFGFYSLVYAGFIIINTIKPKLMEVYIFLGLNLAVVYGFGLIILAIVMGLIYNSVCTNLENKMNNPEKRNKK